MPLVSRSMCGLLPALSGSSTVHAAYNESHHSNATGRRAHLNMYTYWTECTKVAAGANSGSDRRLLPLPHHIYTVCIYALYTVGYCCCWLSSDGVTLVGKRGEWRKQKNNNNNWMYKRIVYKSHWKIVIKRNTFMYMDFFMCFVFLQII